ncbi:uncharacterized protein LOC115824878 [Chanos chanos]|uniref:Uncharacterized protein LOC115824878 n=1 Tax=Chanos chanos TaxID=29144 RepID=A0A6J2WJH6_CHACN|nr:uncharacterized protein LOC115824878 [Chanos chanos]
MICVFCRTQTLIEEGRCDVVTKEKIDKVVLDNVRLISEVSLMIILPALSRIAETEPESYLHPSPDSSASEYLVDLIQPRPWRPLDYFFETTDELLLEKVVGAFDQIPRELFSGHDCLYTDSPELPSALIQEVLYQVNTAMRAAWEKKTSRDHPLKNFYIMDEFCNKAGDLLEFTICDIVNFFRVVRPWRDESFYDLELMTQQVTTALSQTVNKSSYLEERNLALLDRLSAARDRLRYLSDKHEFVKSLPSTESSLSAESTASTPESSVSTEEDNEHFSDGETQSCVSSEFRTVVDSRGSPLEEAPDSRSDTAVEGARFTTLLLVRLLSKYTQQDMAHNTQSSNEAVCKIIGNIMAISSTSGSAQVLQTQDIFGKVYKEIVDELGTETILEVTAESQDLAFDRVLVRALSKVLTEADIKMEGSQRPPQSEEEKKTKGGRFKLRIPKLTFRKKKSTDPAASSSAPEKKTQKPTLMKRILGVFKRSYF